MRYAPFQYPGGEWTSWQKLSGAIRLVLFYDVGNVWDNIFWTDPTSRGFNTFAQSIGLGLRYNTFFGALRADLGFKLYDPSGDFTDGNTVVTPQKTGKW